MSFGLQGPGLGMLNPGADLSSSQFLFAVTDGSGNVIVNTSAGGNCLGVIQNAPTSGNPVSLWRAGSVSKVKAGGAIPFVSGGTPVKSDGSGQAVAQGGSGVILGYALEAASGSGVLIAVALGQ